MGKESSNEAKLVDNGNDDDMEETIDKILKYYDCLDLKQVMFNSIIKIACNNDIAEKEKGLQWYKYWIARYGERMAISLDQASKLCKLASNAKIIMERVTTCVDDMIVSSPSSDRHMGEDIQVLLPTRSGHFHEDVCENMVPIPIATKATDLLGVPPQRICENGEDYSEGIDDTSRDNDDEDNYDSDNPINMLL